MWRLKYVLLAIPFSFSWLFAPKEAGSKNLYYYDKPIQYSDDSAKVVLSLSKKDNNFTIKDTIDLLGKTWYLPENITLNINGGLIKNGVIIGNNTRLQYKGVVFDRIHIRGEWLVPKIKTSMFVDLSYENSLRDVFSLANTKIKNTILVERGNYYLSALKKNDRCLMLYSNTDVILNGTLILTPNSFEEYSVMFVNGENVVIRGTGTIIGDKRTHLGASGEWGMGIHVHKSNNIKISGIKVKDCWGDCIYIGGSSKDVVVEKCFLDNGRRQGISVTSATNVTIKSCTISNVGGTSPQYAIDIEPNADNLVENVYIDKVKVVNCQGGFMSYGKAKNAKIGLIKISKCIIEGGTLCPLYFQNGKSVTIQKCTLRNNDANYIIVCNDIDDARVENNTIVTSNKQLLLDKTISVNNYKTRRLKKNKLNN